LYSSSMVSLVSIKTSCILLVSKSPLITVREGKGDLNYTSSMI
jgi:hypothetical protein